MSRLFSTDFANLNTFFGSYSLREKIEVPEFLQLLKRVHKPHLCLLTLLAEVEAQAGIDGNLKKRRFRRSFDYFHEAVSDVGLASFCFTHGAIKPARIMIRSSIETLIKGIASYDSPKILITKSVFGVIDEAKRTSFFLDPIPRRLLEQLETKYGILCEDVHTARHANMAHVSALNSFPSFDTVSSTETADLISETSKHLLSTACLFYREYFFGMHFQNRDVVITCLQKNVKKNLHGL